MARKPTIDRMAARFSCQPRVILACRNAAYTSQTISDQVSLGSQDQYVQEPAVKERKRAGLNYRGPEKGEGRRFVERCVLRRNKPLNAIIQAKDRT